MKRFYLFALMMIIIGIFNLATAEDNNTILHATPISVNADVSEYISSNKDIDCFRFELEKAGIVKIRFSHEYEDTEKRWMVQLMNEDENILMEHAFEGRALKAIETCSVGLPSGVFFVKVKPFYSGNISEKEYSLCVKYEESDFWETESNNNIAYENDLIPVNTNISGSISIKKDVDYYRFEIEKPGPVSISFSHEYEETELRWTVELLNSDGVLLTGKNFRGDTLPSITMGSVGLPRGEYYIKINQYYNDLFSTKTYTFCVNYEQSENWEKEINNNISIKNTIPLNEHINGAINTQKDIDCYCFEMDNDGTVIIDFSHDYEESELRWNLEVLDAQGNTCLNEKYRGDEMKEMVSRTIALKKGKYFIKVSPYYNGSYSSITYSLCVNYNIQDDYE